MTSPARRTARFSILAALLSTCVLSSCISRVLHSDNAQQVFKNDEFEKAINVQTMPDGSQPEHSGLYVSLPGPEPVAAPVLAATPKPAHKTRKEKLAEKRAEKKAEKTASREAHGAVPTSAATAAKEEKPDAPKAHEPAMEDGEGFIGRRPAVDPYRVGEKVTLDVSYFGVSAGDVTVEVRPFIQVNGKKSYVFAGTARTTSVFAVFYAVDDWFETYVDYESMAPSTYALHVKETKQLRETRAVFDWKTKLATWWDKKIDSEQHVEERKKEWEIPLYAQNVFSIPFYLRAFTLKPGKKLAFVVAHENENLTVTAEVLRKEHIETEAGPFDTVVVKPKIELNGVFRPVGDILIWLTDDDHKQIVRIESKIKIGTIVGVAKKIEP